MTTNVNKIIAYFCISTFTIHALSYFNIVIPLISNAASFAYLTFVPGLIFIALLRINRISLWEYLLSSIGLSLSFLMIIGTLTNWILPIANISSMPLSQPILNTVTDFSLVLIAIITYLSRRTNPTYSNIKGASFIVIGKYVFPIIFPVLSVLGANYLTNVGSNAFTLISLIAIPIVIVAANYLDKSSNSTITPWYIWMISLSIAYMGWLRGNYVSGADINLEYTIFQIVKDSSIWSYSQLSHAYNACLSITMLPLYFSNYIDTNDVYIFKYVLPIIYSLIPVVVYVFLRRILSHTFSLLSSFFFILQPTFMTWWWIPVRQEFSLLFFALSIMIIFNTQMSRLSKNLLFFIFSFAMIVSHYSTTYIALAIFITTFLLSLFYNNFLKLIKLILSRYYINRIHNEKLVYVKPFLSLFKIIILLVFSFFWYAQITTISGNIFTTLEKVSTNLSKINSEENKSDGASLKSQISLMKVSSDKYAALQKAQRDFRTEYIERGGVELYSPESFVKYIPKLVSQELTPNIISIAHTSKVYFVVEVAKKFYKLFISIGTIYLLFYGYKKFGLNLELSFMFMSAFMIMILMLILPYVSIDYDIMRTYQQLLLLLSAPMVIGSYVILRFVKLKPLFFVLLSIILTLGFYSNSGVLSQIIGNSIPMAHLNSYGDSYNQFYFHESEWHTANWMRVNISKESLVYSDNRSSYRLWYLNPIEISMVRKQVFPSTIGKDSYVYSGYVNTIKEVNYLSYKGDIINFQYPSNFLKEQKNIVYSTNSSKVYK